LGPSTSWLPNFSAMDKRVRSMLWRLWVFIHWEEVYPFFHPSTSWLQNVSTTAERVTTCSQSHKFSSMERRVTHFSSIHKLVTDLFNHRQDCYNMLLRLWVFIHWAEGYTFFHPSTSWLRNFSTTDKRVTTCSWGYKFSSIERSIFFIHLQAGYRTFRPQTRGLQHALDVTIFHPLRGGLHNFFIYLQADYVTFHPQKKRVTASLSNHSALSVAGWLL
jgi:hypothetical protein